MLEQTISRDLPNLFDDVQTSVVIDDIESLPGTDGQAVSVRFHLDGAWASPASFTFPFATFVPLEESLGDLRDLVTRSWQNAHVPPGHGAKAIAP
ncbi:MAG: hypothetical protein FJW31_01325 [Acidobacteria bacterium]|nr:hypothetical protein [Acidobacteriota bacterium]